MDTSTATAATGEVNLDALSDEQLEAYFEKGELPAKAETKETSDDSGKPAVETGAAPDAADKDTKEPVTEPVKRESRAERRIRQLTDKVKNLEAQLSAKPGTEARTESTVVASTSKAPRLKSFTDQIGTKYADYDAAHEAWEDARDAFSSNSVAEVLKTERAKLEQAKAEETAKQTTQEHAKEFAKRADTFRKTLTEDKFQEHFTDVYEAVNEAMETRPEVGKIADKLVALEVGPQLVNYFGENPDEFDELLALPIDDALFELGKLAVSEKIKVPTPKTKTAARKIGTSVRGVSAADDAELAAVESGNMEALIGGPIRW